jgi:hypothetical protein
VSARYALPPPAPYQGPQRCVACAGAKVTGQRYEFNASSGQQVLLVDEFCPTCGGCGRHTHDGCAPADHADWQPSYDDPDDGDDRDGEDVCPSCRGRRWWVCQGFTETQIHHLRVACGCARDLLVEVTG